MKNVYASSPRSKEMETDLHLLLECLNCQIYDPVSIKQSLLAIGSLCATNSRTKDVLRDDGGLHFILKLLFTTKEDDIREAALYTLGCAVENNVYSQKFLATSAVFSFMRRVLRQQPASPRLLQTACFLLLSLVTNNSHGQMLARTSECLDALFHIFKTCLPNEEPVRACETGEESWFEELEGRSVEVWSAATSAICGCLNNPQNDDNQRLCASVFPQALVYLQEHVTSSVVRPITSLLGLAVANNYHNQQRMHQAGGVKVLMSALHRSVNRIELPNHQDMAACISSTLDTLVSDNASLSVECGKLGMVSLVSRLLLCPAYRPPSLIRFVITLGHLLENSAENRKQFIEMGGMGTLVALLTHSDDSELMNAAKYVLHNCVDGASNQVSSQPQLKHRDIPWTDQSNLQPIDRQQSHKPSTAAAPHLDERPCVERMIDEKFKALERRLSADRKEADRVLHTLSPQRALSTAPRPLSASASKNACGLPPDRINPNLIVSDYPQGYLQLPLEKNLSHGMAPPASLFTCQVDGNIPPRHSSGSAPSYIVPPANQHTQVPMISSQHQTFARPAQTVQHRLPLEARRNDDLNSRQGELLLPNIDTSHDNSMGFLGRKTGEKLNQSQMMSSQMCAPVIREGERQTVSGVSPVPKAFHSRQSALTSKLRNQLEKERKLRQNVEAKAHNLQQTLRKKEKEENAQAVAQELKRQEKKVSQQGTRKREHLRRTKSRLVRVDTSPEADDSPTPGSQTTPGSPSSTSTPNLSSTSSNQSGKKETNHGKPSHQRSKERVKASENTNMEKKRKESSKSTPHGRLKETLNKDENGASEESNKTQERECVVSVDGPERSHGTNVSLQTDLSPFAGSCSAGTAASSNHRLRCQSVGVQTPSCLDTLPAKSREAQLNSNHGDAATQTLQPLAATGQLQAIGTQTFVAPSTPAPRTLLATPRYSSNTNLHTPSNKRFLKYSVTPKYSVKKMAQIPIGGGSVIYCTPMKRSRIMGTSARNVPPSPCQSEFDFQLLQQATPTTNTPDTLLRTPVKESTYQKPCHLEERTPVCQEDQEGSNQPPKLIHSSCRNLRQMVMKKNWQQQCTEERQKDGTGSLAEGDGHCNYTDDNFSGTETSDESSSDVDGGGDVRRSKEKKNVTTSKCPACHPPDSINGPLLTSRNYNIVIETNPYTCSKHRLIRRTERHFASQVKVNKESKPRPLEGLLNQSPLTEGDRGKPDPYTFTNSTDSDYETVFPPTPPLLPTPSPAVYQNTNRQRRRSRVPYTDQEIVNLKEGVFKLGKFWQQILATYDFHPTRSAVDLMEKYKRLTTASACPPPRPTSRNPFSMAEERRLRRGVRLYGYNWKVIHKAFKFSCGRRPQDLKDKWHNLHRQQKA